MRKTKLHQKKYCIRKPRHGRKECIEGRITWGLKITTWPPPFMRSIHIKRACLMFCWSLCARFSHVQVWTCSSLCHIMVASSNIAVFRSAPLSAMIFITGGTSSNLSASFVSTIHRTAGRNERHEKEWTSLFSPPPFVISTLVRTHL